MDDQCKVIRQQMTMHSFPDIEDGRGDSADFDVTLSVLHVFDNEDHQFLWTVHSMQFIKQTVMPQLIEGLGEIHVDDERSGLL